MTRSVLLAIRSSCSCVLALLVALFVVSGCGGSSGDDTGGNGGGGGGGHAGKGGSGGGGGVVEDAAHPFGSRPMKYPSDVKLPTGAQSDLDAAVTKAYDYWKKTYLKQGCGAWYVYSGGGTGDAGDMVSEGQGYGMMIVALMAGYDPDAQTIFDGLYQFSTKFPTGSHRHLMAWTVDVGGGCKLLTDQTDSATDGDLDIAYALLLADKQWPGNGWMDKFNLMISDVKGGDINKNTHETSLGDASTFDDPNYNSTRPSDFILDHLRAYGAATKDDSWMQSVDATYALVATMQAEAPATTTGLLPDFIVDTATAPKPAAPGFLEGAGDGSYDYNSCRVPWRITTDYIVSGDARAKKAMDPINKWIISTTKSDPGAILDGYNLDGTVEQPTKAGPSSAFSSPFAVSAMLSGNQDWLDKLWKSRALDEDYFGDSITMLSMIVLSGNWWAPQAVQ